MLHGKYAASKSGKREISEGIIQKPDSGAGAAAREGRGLDPCPRGDEAKAKVCDFLVDDNKPAQKEPKPEKRLRE